MQQAHSIVHEISTLLEAPPEDDGSPKAAQERRVWESRLETWSTSFYQQIPAVSTDKISTRAAGPHCLARKRPSSDCF